MTGNRIATSLLFFMPPADSGPTSTVPSLPGLAPTICILELCHRQREGDSVPITIAHTLTMREQAPIIPTMNAHSNVALERSSRARSSRAGRTWCLTSWPCDSLIGMMARLTMLAAC